MKLVEWLLLTVVLHAAVNLGIIIYILSRVLKLHKCIKILPENRGYLETRKAQKLLEAAHYHPFVAAICVKQQDPTLADTLKCGSTIIAPKWLITSAHCLCLLVDYKFAKHMVYVSSGNHYWPDGNKHDVVDWVCHERFAFDILAHDIGLMKVKQRFSGRREKVAFLAPKTFYYQRNITAKVFGWNFKNEDDKIAKPNLTALEVRTIPYSYCKRLYRKMDEVLTRTMFCAEVVEGEEDTCQLNFGGPVFSDGYVIGIATSGINCGDPRQAGVYTKVSLYIDWIEIRKSNLNISDFVKLKNV